MGFDQKSAVDRLVAFCASLGYELNVVGSEGEIPNVERDFEQALHVSHQIWVVGPEVEPGWVWHEAGHALVEATTRPEMAKFGAHWNLMGVGGDEGAACSAAAAIMQVFGVPRPLQHEINEEVNHCPDDDPAHAREQAEWVPIVEARLKRIDHNPVSALRGRTGGRSER